MICNKCGTDFEGKFCPKCGTPADGKPHCPKCGAELSASAKFCNECGYSLEQKGSNLSNGVSSAGEKIKKFFASLGKWIKQHVKLTVFISFVLVAAIVLLCLIPVFTSIFKVSKVSKIDLGYTQAQVREILGDPYTKESNKKTWVYYEDDYIDLNSVNDDLTEEDLDDMDWEDFEGALEDEIAAEEKALKQTFKKITVNFEQLESDDDTASKEYTVTSIWLDKEYSANVLKGAKKTLDEATIITGEIMLYSKATEFPITYEAEYTDGSYVKAAGTATYQDTQTEKNDDFWKSKTTNSKIAVKWSNSWCDSHVGELKVVDSDGYVVEGTKLSILIDTFKAIPTDIIPTITDIVVEEGVTKLKQNAFGGFTSLQNVTLPSTLTSIERYAFSECSNLTSIVIPDSVTSIGENAFASCTKLRTINIPNGITKINNYTFHECSSLQSIIIPSSVTEIVSGAFSGCTSLIEVINKSTLNIEKGSESHGYVAYYALQVLTEEPTTSNFATSGEFDFYNLNNTYYLLGYSGTATELVLPDNVNGNSYIINASAFANNQTLTSVTISSGVIGIGHSAFANCKGLTAINFNATTMADLTSNDEVFSDAGQSGTGITVTVGANVIKIPAYLFECNNSSYGAIKITSLVFAENSQCVLIGDYAFYDCDSLTTVSLPSGVTNINNAFSNCSGLASITVDANNTAYASQDGILYNKAKTSFMLIPSAISGSVTIPNTITSISYSTFSSCEKLQGITIDASNENYSSIDGVLYNKTQTTLIYYPKGKTDSSFTIPSGVTRIYDYAFRDCNNLTSVTISASVNTIEYSAFADCTKLTSVTFENTTGWKRSSTPINSAELANATIAATYLTTTYDNYTWTRSDS